MFIQSGTIGIIADDLTGANDTALQFHLSGANTQILFDYTQGQESLLKTQVWAMSTETRNLPKEEAVVAVKKAVNMLNEHLNTEYFFKKIDSTLRGNIGTEIQTILDELGWDAAVVVPAFPSEGRTTVGGYHLLKGIPIERTEFARDPKAPVKDSYVPSLLASQVNVPETVGLIPLKTVAKGAGPILIELHNLIKDGKRIIVADAVSTTDMEQIVLAMEKSTYKILPCGTAALAQSFADIWIPEMEYHHIPETIPDIPIFVIAGSATSLTRLQVEKLTQCEDFEPYIVDLNLEKINTVVFDEMVDKVSKNLLKHKLVVVYFSTTDCETEKNLQYAKEHNILPEDIPSIITDYLAKLTKDVVAIQEVILVMAGGETSFKCCRAIESNNLQVIDEADFAIPLCLDYNARWIVTKSGNLGGANTLINILKFLERHK